MSQVEELARVAVLRGTVRESIMACEKCSLAPGAFDDETGSMAIARRHVPFRGPTPARLMMLGEAPGGMEDRTSRPFIGPSGQLIARMLLDAGLPPIAEWFVTNPVCCRSEGPPRPEHLSACLSNLRAQLNLANPEWVLTLGAVALSATGMKGKVTQVHGRPFYCPAGPFIGRWVLPTYHPAAALRDPAVAPRIGADLSTLRNLLSGKLNPHDIEASVGRGGKLNLGITEQRS